MENRYMIEHHFEQKDVLPAYKQIMHGVKIISVRERGEFLIENGFGKERGNINITAGGLRLSVRKKDFVEELRLLNKRR